MEADHSLTRKAGSRVTSLAAGNFINACGIPMARLVVAQRNTLCCAVFLNINLVLNSIDCGIQESVLLHKIFFMASCTHCLIWRVY
jgi:hypothetical protein